MVKASKSLTPEKITEGILTMVVALLLFYAVTAAAWLPKVALAVGLLGLFVRPLARWLAVAFFKIVEVLGFINSRVLLAVVYYLALVPLAFLSRLLGSSNDLQLKRKDGSYFKTENRTYTPQDFENLW